MESAHGATWTVLTHVVSGKDGNVQGNVVPPTTPRVADRLGEETMSWRWMMMLTLLKVKKT